MQPVRVYLIKRRRGLLSGRVAHYWVLKWAGSDGFPVFESLGRVGAVTKAQAKAALERKRLALGAGEAPRDRMRPLALSEFRRAHEEAYGVNVRPGTRAVWREAVGHAIAAVGDVRLDQLDFADAGRVRAAMEGAGLRQMTVRKNLVTLKAMLARAVRARWLHRNPFDDAPVGPMEARAKRIFTPAELDAMVAAAPSPWWRAMVTLAYTSGLRRTELWHLRWEDVDLEAGAVRVQERPAGRRDAGDGVEVPILAWAPKTRGSARTVPVPGQAVAELQRLRLRSDGSPYVFVTVERLLLLDRRAGSGRLRERYELLNNFTREFDAVQAAAGVRPRGTFHDLRKTFGTRAASAGVPMHELRQWMGHSSITTTAAHYLGVEEQAADRLRGVWAAGKAGAA